jgi:RimJ/RimL family protein N-acetyltransferase
MHDSKKYFIITNRLGFRRWREDDLPLALGLWGDYEVTKLIDARGQLTTNQVQDRLIKEIATEKEYGVQYWPIFLRETGEHVGGCGLRPYDLAKGTYEIGFHIRSAHWRCGYATEAARAVMKFAFNELKAKALFAGHNPKNVASRALLEKLGFRYARDEYYPLIGLKPPSYLLNDRNELNEGILNACPSRTSPATLMSSSSAVGPPVPPSPRLLPNMATKSSFSSASISRASISGNR